MSHLPNTERVNPASERLDGAPLPVFLEAMLDDHRRVLDALRLALPEITRLAEHIAVTLESGESGGRVILAGAGTSGRLAALEAAECPPTFGTDPERIVAVVAGGPAAMLRSVEGAEDDADAGREAIAALDAGIGDLVVAVSASGRTPFALAAVEEGRRRGAATAAVVCSSATTIVRAADLAVVLECGPEFVAGSTRLKAGSAQKIALNLATTGAMVRLGRVRAGRMVAMRATNAKLRARALRIIGDLTGADDAEAARLLDAAEGDLFTVVRDISAPASEARATSAPTFHLRQLSPTDAAAVTALASEPEVVATTAPFAVLGGEELFRSWLARPGLMLGALSDERLAGVVLLETRRALLREHVGDITYVAVDPSLRGRGVAESLVRQVLDWAARNGITRVELRVWPDNVRAVRLYGRLGFEIEGRLRGHAVVEGRVYDALLMAWLAPELAAARVEGKEDDP